MTEAERELWNRHSTVRDNAAIAEIMHFYRDWLKSVKADYIRKYPKLRDEMEVEVDRGFVDAVQRCDPNRDSFKSYASQRIFGTVVDYLRSENMFGHRNLTKAISIHEERRPDDDGADTAIENLLTAQTDHSNIEIFQRLFHILRDRGSKYWFVINAIYREGWQQSQVAQWFNVSESTVTNWKAEAIGFLRKSYALRQYLAGRRSYRRNSRGISHKGLKFHIRNKGHKCIECSKSAYRRGRCSEHYRQFIASDTRCQHCSKPVYAKGLCRSHWDQERIKQKPLCRVPGCNCKSVSRGMCKKHLSEASGIQCSTVGCSGFVYAKGLCNRCYQRVKVPTVGFEPTLTCS